MCDTMFESARSPADSLDRGIEAMKNFVYGLLMGAACAYLYVSHGAYIESTLDGMLAWRNSAQSSISGYGGKPRSVH